jgi:ferredoxin
LEEIVRIRVDFELCESHARCVEAAPEVFAITDEDFLVVRKESPGENLRRAVETAAERCPRHAIQVDG